MQKGYFFTLLLENFTGAQYFDFHFQVGTYFECKAVDMKQKYRFLSPAQIIVSVAQRAK